MYGPPPDCKKKWRLSVCENVSGLLVESQLLATMRYARLCPYKLLRLLDDRPLSARCAPAAAALEAAAQLQPISVRIMKSSISIFEEKTTSEITKRSPMTTRCRPSRGALYFDSVSSVLRFIRSIEASRFDG
jgi:hypothetical protein